MPQLDLIVRGGQLTTAPVSAIVDIGIVDGRIVQLGGEMQAARELDAHGKLLLPGGVLDGLLPLAEGWAGVELPPAMGAAMILVPNMAPVIPCSL